MAAPKRTVLILDMDDMTSELYRRELSRQFVVMTVSSEQEARQTLETNTVDAIVLEPTALDDEDWKFVAQLRKVERYREMPVVVCSTLDARRRGAELGTTAYLIKPVTPRMLSDVLTSLLEGATPITGR